LPTSQQNSRPVDTSSLCKSIHPIGSLVFFFGKQRAKTNSNRLGWPLRSPLRKRKVGDGDDEEGVPVVVQRRGKTPSKQPGDADEHPNAA
jgi:hypothetical protein